MESRAAARALLPALLLAAGAAFADGALSVEGAVKLAMDRNRDLSRSMSALAAADRVVGASWNGFLPSVSVGAGLAEPNGGQASASGTASVGVALSAAALNAMDTAKAQRAIAELEYQAKRRDVELAVRKAYLSLALAAENVRLLERSAETAKASADQVESRRKAGLAPELDSLTALVAVEKLKPSLANARLAYETQKTVLRRALGLGPDDEVTIDEEEALKDVRMAGKAPEALVGKAADEAPSVRALGAALALAEARLKAAERLVWAPTVSLSLSYKPTWTGGAYRDTGSVSASASLSADSFLPWSSERQAVASAKEALALAQDKLAEARDEATLSARSLARRIEQSGLSLEALRLGASLAERTLSLTEEAYRFGTKDLLAVQNASDALRSARLQELSEGLTLALARLDLEYLIGVPFGTLRGDK